MAEIDWSEAVRDSRGRVICLDWCKYFRGFADRDCDEMSELEICGPWVMEMMDEYIELVCRDCETGCVDRAENLCGQKRLSEYFEMEQRHANKLSRQWQTEDQGQLQAVQKQEDWQDVPGPTEGSK